MHVIFVNIVTDNKNIEHYILSATDCVRKSGVMFAKATCRHVSICSVTSLFPSNYYRRIPYYICMAESSGVIISWNPANWITVVLMVAIGFAVLGAAARIYQQKQATS